MLSRQLWVAVIAVLCALAGIANGTPVATADDDTGIDVAADTVAIASDGECSLREALTNVVTQTRTWTDCITGKGVSIINLPAGVYNLGGTELPGIDGDSTRLIIRGAGAQDTVIDAGNASRIIQVFDDRELTFDGVTLRHGKAQVGGAAYLRSGATVTIIDSALEDNTATKNGGAIALQDGGAVNIFSSTFSGNTATTNGGALYLVGAYTTTIANSTFAGNSAVNGGAIVSINTDSTAVATVLNTTFVGNNATGTGSALDADTGAFLLKNTLVSKGTSVKGSCAGAITSQSVANLTNDASCSKSFTNNALLGLSSFDFHGGSTKNYLPVEGSPAIDAGNDAVCTTSPVTGVDQRHLTRVGQGTHCDIGAIEVQTTTTGAPKLSAAKTVSGTFVSGGSVTYSVTIKNDGDGPQPDNAGHEFTDVLPSQLRLDSVDANGGTATASLANNTVSWDGSISAGGAATITIHATIVSSTKGDTVSNQGQVTFDTDGDSTNDATVLTDDPDTIAPLDATSFVITGPDIHVVKTTTSAGLFHPGDTISYKVDVRNNGNAIAQGVVLSDTLDANTTLVTGSVVTTAGAVTSGGSPGDTIVGVNIGDISAGSAVTISFDATLITPAPDGLSSITNQAVVSGANFDMVMSDNDDDGANGIDPTTSTIVTNPQLSLDLSTDAITIEAGDTISYTLSYKNTGDIDLSNLVLNSTVPLHTTFDPSSPGGWDCNPDENADSVCILSVGALAGGTSGHATFTVLVDDVIPMDATTIGAAALITSAATSSSASLNTPIGTAALAATLTGPATTTPGDQLAYTVTVNNSGTANAKDVTITTTLPPGLTFAASTGCSASGQTVTCLAGDIAEGDDITVTINTTVDTAVDDGDTFSLQASVTRTGATAPVTTNTVTTTVQAPVITATLDGPATATPGTPIAYTVTVTNSGSGTAKDVTVTSVLPAGLTFTSSPNCSASGQTVTCLAGDLAGGDDVTVIINTTVDTAADDGDIFSLQANVTWIGATTPVTTNTVTTTVQVPVITATLDGPTSTTPGESIAYVVTVNNSGSATATDVTITSVLPAGLTFAPSTGCNASGQTVTCLAGDIAEGNDATVTINTTVDASADNSDTFSVQANVTWTGANAPVTTNTIVTTVQAPTISAVLDGSATAMPGASVAYTVTVSNSGSATAKDVTITTTLPPGLTSATSPDCSASGQTVTCLAGDIAGGDDATVTINTAVDANADDGDTFTLQANVTRTGATTALTTNTVVTTVQVPVITATLDGPAAATPGEQIAYIVTVTNSGSATATDVTITSVLPAGLTFAPSTGCNASGQTVTCLAGDIAAEGDDATVTINTTVDTAADDGDTFSLQGDATWTGATTPVTTNTMTTTVQTPTISAVLNGPATATPGASIAYTITATNSGSATAKNVTITSVLPTGLTFAASPNCSASGQTLTCLAGDIAEGDDATVTINTAVDANADDGDTFSLQANVMWTGTITPVTTNTVVTTVHMPATVRAHQPDLIIPQPSTTPGSATYTYDLHFRWTLITWVGQDSVAPSEILDRDSGGEAETYAAVEAVYAWDAADYNWTAFFPGASIPGANNLDAFRFGQVYWVAINSSNGVAWTVATGGSSTQ